MALKRISLLTVLFALPLAGQMTVSITSSVPSPASLGTVVTWTASPSNQSPGTLWYRFRTAVVNRSTAHIAAAGEGLTTWQTVVDFGPNPSFNWTTIDQEGLYQIEVAVENTSTGEQATATGSIQLTSLVIGNNPVITPTANPLVFLYSAPPCAPRSTMSVQFQGPGGVIQSTPAQKCGLRTSMNFYLAGLLGNTAYTAWDTVYSDSPPVTSTLSTFTTGAVGFSAPKASIVTPAPTALSQGILLQSLIQNNAVATDLNGNVLWYGPGNISFLTRPVTGGTFVGIFEDGAQDPSHQFIEEFDLAWNVVAQTNAGRVNQQLAAMGMHPINAFHHEVRKLPLGGYLVLADSERILTDVQGPGPIDVIGDTIIVLDSDLQVSWAWDSFDHLDPHRTAILGEGCTYPGGLQCAPFYQAKSANDWLHGNSLQIAPDGNIIYSSRHQDWIIKIDYHNGDGTGAVLWRLGKGGDFTINSLDSNPWFSHQHDANFLADNTSLLVFDDGNTRIPVVANGHSRGQKLTIDEQHKTASLTLNADLGGYSYALGSAQLLPDGNYHFDSGAIAGPTGFAARAIEVDPNGTTVYSIQFGTLTYRSFRMPDIYTAP